MNLSIITANLPAMKRFLYELGQSGTQLTQHQHAEYELGSKPWSGSKTGADPTTGGFNRRHESKVFATAREAEVHSEGGSETGILRVVDMSVEIEDAPSNKRCCSASEQFGHDGFGRY